MAPTRPHPRRSTRDSLAEPCSPSPVKKIPAKSGTTPMGSPTRRSPLKNGRKLGITIAQKQALIENMKLEFAERARRLRAQYRLQAQNVRTTIELRVNRIPLHLRKITMAELIKRAEAKSCNNGRPPPVPEKDVPPQRPNFAAKPLISRPHAPPPARRGSKRLSTQISGADKENETANIENPKKRFCASPIRGESSKVQPGQVLSPTTSNTRVPRERPVSPAKHLISRPASPLKPATTPATTLASKMRTGTAATVTSAARSRVVRAAMPPPTITRKVTTSSVASSAATSTTSAASRGRRPAASTATTTAASGRPRRKVSNSSAATTATSAATGTRRGLAVKADPAPKKTVMSTIRKGVTAATARKNTTTKAAATKPAAKTTAATSTRSLRKRN